MSQKKFNIKQQVITPSLCFRPVFVNYSREPRLLVRPRVRQQGHVAARFVHHLQRGDVDLNDYRFIDYRIQIYLLVDYRNRNLSTVLTTGPHRHKPP